MPADNGLSSTQRLLAIARSGSIFGNGQVLVMRTVEDQAYSLSLLVSCEQSVRLDHLALTINPLLGLHRELSQGLFLGKRQLMILTPWPLFLTSRL
jgi:hypothetical protein